VEALDFKSSESTTILKLLRPGTAFGGSGKAGSSDILGKGGSAIWSALSASSSSGESGNSHRFNSLLKIASPPLAFSDSFTVPDDLLPGLENNRPNRPNFFLFASSSSSLFFLKASAFSALALAACSCCC
jgi:hypothetical protein